MKNIIKHQHGFSMVEILVSFGLLSVLTLGLMKLFENSTKTSKDIQTKDEINQFNQELTMILSNPTNCEANLGGRRISINDPIDPFQMGGVQTFLNGESRTIHNVGTNRTEMDRRQRTTIALAEITNVDFNSSQGNNAIIDLEVTYEKPGVVFETPGDQSVNNNRIGSQTVRRIIKIGASLCPRTLHIGTAQNPCPQGSNLVEGPTQILINGQPSLVNNQPQVWGVCETCFDVNGAPVTPNSPIVSCNSIAAGGGGVNLDNLSATLCLRQGGTINPDGTCTQANNTPTVTPDVQCTQLGGTWNPRSTPPRCDGLSDLTQFQTLINELRTSLNEQCQNFGGTLINGKCDMKLFGGKSMKDCLDFRGQIIKVQHNGSAVNLCRFDGSSCPPSFTQLNNWSTTVPKTCYSIVDFAGGFNTNSAEKNLECLQFANGPLAELHGRSFASISITASHTWDDKDNQLFPERITYYKNLCIYDQNSGKCGEITYQRIKCPGDGNIARLTSSESTCTSQITQIGCY